MPSSNPHPLPSKTPGAAEIVVYDIALVLHHLPGAPPTILILISGWKDVVRVHNLRVPVRLAFSL
jgi:hypothetical protein